MFFTIIAVMCIYEKVPMVYNVANEQVLRSLSRKRMKWISLTSVSVFVCSDCCVCQPYLHMLLFNGDYHGDTALDTVQRALATTDSYLLCG